MSLPADDKWRIGPDGTHYSLAPDNDQNDLWALTEELAKFKVGTPTQGLFWNPEAQEQRFADFAKLTPPDLTANTRIVAILGVTHANPESGDGFFVSDFCAFWHLFHGQTKHQTWLHCLDFPKYLANHDYYHGNPFTNRKIVLNQKIFEEMSASDHPLELIKPANLLLKAKQAIRREFEEADAANENLLILLFGHGMCEGKGIVIGSRGKGTESKMTTAQLAKELRGNAKVTLLTNACFSAGWVYKPLLNLTASTAAGQNNASLSWTKSRSTGRASGSIWASMIIERLTLDPDTQEDFADGEMTEFQESTYSNFTNQCYKTLLEKYDRRGYEHQFSFLAQDDGWGSNWRQRTGIPLADFRGRWNSLQDAGPDKNLHPGDPLNRDPNVPQSVRDDFEKQFKALPLATGDRIFITQPYSAQGSVLGKRKASPLYAGPQDSGHDRMCRIAEQFFDSFPGVPEEAPNVALFGLLQQMIRGVSFDDEEIDRAYQGLAYRMGEMDDADYYLMAMNIPLPDNKQCHAFDQISYRYNCLYSGEKEIKSRFEELSTIMSECNYMILFPQPLASMGQHSSKGKLYLIAAFDMSGLNFKDVKSRLKAMVALIEREVDDEKRVLKRSPEIISKRRKLFEACGKVWGDMSPVKKGKKRQSKNYGIE